MALKITKIMKILGVCLLYAAMIALIVVFLGGNSIFVYEGF